MPIDYSLLRPIDPKSGVVANINPNPAPGGLDQLASGLTAGANALQARQQSQAQTADTQQRTAQDAAMAPGDLQLQNQKIQDNQNILDSNAAQARDSATERTAAQQGFQQYIKSRMATGDVAGAIKVQQQQANLEQTMNIVAEKTGQNSDHLNIKFGNFASTVMASDQKTGKPLLTPQQREDAYQQYLKTYSPSARQMFPEHFEEGTGVNMIMLGHVAHANLMEEQEIKQAKTQDRVTPQIQNAQRIASLTNNQNRTPEEDTELKQLESGATKQGSNPFDKAIADGGEKAVTGREQQSQALSIVHADAQDGLKILDKIPAGYTGPVVDFLKANGLNSDVQKLQKLTAGIPIAVKAMYGVTPGNRLTTTELQQLNKASGTTSQNKDALQYVLRRLIPQTEGIMHDNWQKSDAYMKNSSPNVYDGWKSANPEPQGFKFGDKGNPDAPGGAQNDLAKAKEGDTARDSKGNRAKFTNGKWVEIK